MRKFLRDNGLTIALALMFAGSLAAMAWSGWLDTAQEAQVHGEAAPSLRQFLASGNFIGPMFENWESEFLQMSVYVVLTAILFQRGSAESRDPDSPGRDDDEVSPGVAGWLYAHSLGLALAGLFVASFLLHAWGGWHAAIDDAARHGGAHMSLRDYLGDARFWFESMQNWQSEFLSTGALVVLSIFLRHKGSPESKPVRRLNSETGI